MIWVAVAAGFSILLLSCVVGVMLGMHQDMRDSWRRSEDFHRKILHEMVAVHNKTVEVVCDHIAHEREMDAREFVLKVNQQVVMGQIPDTKTIAYINDLADRFGLELHPSLKASLWTPPDLN